MDANAPAYAIIICTRCRDPISGALAAQELIARLAEPRAAGQGKVPRFRVETVACMAGCDRPLAVAFRAPEKATYLFGDIAPSTDAAALLSFGELYDSLPDGWCNESRRPVGLRNKTLARVPAPPKVPA